ncbi:DNA translocase FtsK [Actinomadura fulvescens]|uniref:FtsK gamma domain-containing protein n=1 Tax=Actinomadura fulvescens TaxID=46160 RepID=A0ABN3PAX7_9ACTN
MARKTQTLQIAQDATVERIIVAAVSKIGVMVPPWAVLGLVTVIAAISHAKWGQPPAVTWATMAATLSTVVMTGVTWAVSHQRGLLGRAHSTLTALFGGLWFTIATITGIAAQVTLGMLFFGGGTLAVAWNIRAVIRQTPSLDGGSVDPLSFLFDKAKDSFGLSGAKVRTTEVDDYKIRGKLALPAGEKTADDAIKTAPYIESGMRLPPGSVLVAADEDDASQAHVTFSDPRVMKRPLPWPGPYRPGGSIAEALRPGMYQDMSEVLHPFIGHHLQIMGMIGSGKSIGGAWNYLAEIISRRDTGTFGIDISKDEQTLGPVRDGLHRFETTKAGAVDLIRGMHAEIPQRTKWLSAHGFQKWTKGCGLLYWFLWIEEYSKLYEALGEADQTKLEEIIKEIRSAGGSVVISLQRADYTQVPTLIRSQMAKMCFGLADDDDAKFGTSDRQRKAGVAPEQWENHQPGMAYLDAPGIRATHYAMPMRTYAWGKTDNEANANMRAHAAAFPAASKNADEFTARLADPSGSAARPGAAIAMPAASTDADHTNAGHGVGQSQPEAVEGPREGAGDERFTELLAEAAELVVTARHASTAMLQRKLRLSHADCLRVLEVLERRGIIGPQTTEDATGRPVLVPADAEAAQEVLEQLRADGDAVSQHVRTDDPSPDLTAGPDDPITEPGADDVLETPPEEDGTKVSPEAARRLVHDWLRHRAATNRPTFTASDPEFQKIREASGTKRPWSYKVLGELVDDGVLRREKTGATTTFTVIDLAPLDSPGLNQAA